MTRRGSPPPAPRRRCPAGSCRTTPSSRSSQGDGTGPDIWRASQRVFDAAVEKAYGSKRKIAWYEAYAGEEAFNQLGSWLPDGTVEVYRIVL
ncbi:isocitrate/isopropylmalate family dehydrogenase [Sorangium sp. So ce362]